MAAKSKKKKEADLLDVIKERRTEAVLGWEDIYRESAEDMRFVYDVDEGQWPDDIRSKREKDRRPVLTINKLQKFVRQVRGDQKINRSRVKVIPVDSTADPEMATLYNGIIRQIEYLSNAEIAYDTAYMGAVSGAIGYFRIDTEYNNNPKDILSPSIFDQDIRIRRIANPLSVHFDPYAQEFNFEDARYCFIDELIDKKVFEKLYPSADAVNYDNLGTGFGDWMMGDKLRIVEYFYKEFIKQKVALLSNGEIIPVQGKRTAEYLEIMSLETGEDVYIAQEREVESHIVKRLKVTGNQILEKSVWPGRHIPIIPVLGDEIVINGKRYYLSLIRGAKGPQQMYNYWATAATETVALSPKMPFILDHRQVKGFETEWDEANETNRTYIRYNAVQGLNKPSREPQAQVPNAIMTMMQTTSFDIEDHLGRYESSKGEQGNERSKIAIDARVHQSDKGTYTFVDNLTRAIVYAGRQLIDLIPLVYDTPRALRILNESGEESLVNVNQPVVDTEGEMGRENDLSVGKFDLIATAAASYASKRNEMVSKMIESMQYAGPEIAQIIAPLIFKFSDDEGAQEIYAEIQKGIEAQKQQQQMMQQQEMQQKAPVQ